MTLSFVCGPLICGSRAYTRLFYRARFTTLAVFLVFVLSACEKKPTTDTQIAVEPTPPINKERVNTEADSLWTEGANTLSAASNSANELDTAIDQLLASPTQDTLTIAQQKWHEAFLAYRSFYFFHFLGQAASSSFTTLVDLHFRIAAHPIQPGYLDSFGPYLYSGLVHDISTQINRDNLIQQHGLTNTEDAVLGLYAIHFMLFGIDGKRAAADYTAVAKLSDYHREVGFQSITETPNNRRRLLLQEQADILVSDLAALNQTWQSVEPGSLQIAWRTTDAEIKWNLVRRTLQQGLTQLIVDVVALKKMEESDSAETATATAPETSETKTEPSGQTEPEYSSYPAADQKQFILRSIESLLDATPVLKSERREKIENLLKESISLLTETTKPQQDIWAGVYENLKAAVDALNAT